MSEHRGTLTNNAHSTQFSRVGLSRASEGNCAYCAEPNGRFVRLSGCDDPSDLCPGRSDAGQ